MSIWTFILGSRRLPGLREFDGYEIIRSFGANWQRPGGNAG